MARLTYRTRSFRFESRPGFLVFALAALAATVAAGLWQLDRAEQKIAIEERYRAARQQPRVDLEPPLPPVDALQYRRVRLQGRYLDSRQFLLDNRARPGKGPGYEVITPLLLNSGAVVLVNRGWVPAPVDREKLPVIGVKAGPRRVAGRLVREQRGFALGDMDVGADWPRRIQFVDTALIAERLERPVYEGVLMLSPAADAGYRRDWTPVIDGPARHYGYAVQWFAMALAVVILYGFATIKRVRDESS